MGNAQTAKGPLPHLQHLSLRAAILCPPLAAQCLDCLLLSTLVVQCPQGTCKASSAATTATISPLVPHMASTPQRKRPTTCRRTKGTARAPMASFTCSSRLSLHTASTGIGNPFYAACTAAAI